MKLDREHHHKHVPFAGRTVTAGRVRGLAGPARAEVRAGLANAPCHGGWQPITNVNPLHFRLFPMISNQFQSLFKKL